LGAKPPPNIFLGLKAKYLGLILNILAKQLISCFFDSNILQLKNLNRKEEERGAILISVCLYLINVKTAELIGPKFCVGPHMTPGKV